MSISTRTIQPFWNDRLAELYKLACLGQLMSGLLHDLGNPVQLVSLNLQQLKTEIPVSTTSREMLERAILGTHRIQLFLEAGRRYVQQQAINIVFPIAPEINHATTIFQAKAQTARVRILLKIEPNTRLHGDPLKFYQIISNLLSNALDSYQDLEDTPSSPARQIIISAHATTTLITISVQDWGRGVQHSDLDQIFEPFFTTKRAGKGLGIGLAITKEIVEEEFGGRISVESQPGKGTTFTVELPQVIGKNDH
jgi:signal transduction histidine kinase